MSGYLFAGRTIAGLNSTLCGARFPSPQLFKNRSSFSKLQDSNRDFSDTVLKTSIYIIIGKIIILFILSHAQATASEWSVHKQNGSSNSFVSKKMQENTIYEMCYTRRCLVCL
jgi:hypothetical protein